MISRSFLGTVELVTQSFRHGDASTLDWIHLSETGKSFMTAQHQRERQ